MTANDNFTLGKYLQENRERHGLSLKHVSATTKISARIIEAIEKDCAEEILNRVYIRNFSLVLGKKYDLEKERIIELFEITYQANHGRDSSPKKQKTRYFFLFIPLFLFATLFYVLSSKSKTNTLVEKATTQEVVTKPEKKSSTTPVPSLNSSLSDIKEEKQEDKTTQMTTAVDEKKDLPITPKEEKKEEIKEQKDNLKNPAQNESPSFVEEPQTSPLIIQASRGESWITVKVDHNKISSIFLKKETSVTFTGSIILCALGAAKNLDLFYQGRKVKSHLNQNFLQLAFPEKLNSQVFKPFFKKNDSDKLILNMKNNFLFSKNTDN